MPSFIHPAHRKPELREEQSDMRGESESRISSLRSPPVDDVINQRDHNTASDNVA